MCNSPRRFPFSWRKRWAFFISTLAAWSLGVAELAALWKQGEPWLLKNIPYSPQVYYGPMPAPTREGSSLDFSATVSFDGHFPLERMNEFSRREVFRSLLSTIPVSLRLNASEVLETVLKYSEKYKVDPFWALAVTWTESHFRSEAQSHVGAAGPMQIMPATGHYLSAKMGLRMNRRLARQMVWIPEINIEMGVRYLAQLLRTFKGDFVLATVAYNMGPGWVRKRLRKRLPVGTQNRYLDRVRRHYWPLSRPFRTYFRHHPAPSGEKNYVARNSPVPWEWRLSAVEAMDFYLGYRGLHSYPTVARVRVQ